MNWKQFFGFTKSKLIIFLILIVVMNIIPALGSAICVDGYDYGYCIMHYGLPFHSFLISGEVKNIPLEQLSGIITQGIFGCIANIILAYLVLSFVYYHRLKKKLEQTN